MDLMSIRRELLLSMIVNGITLPDGVEVGTFTPSEDCNTYTVSHSLGEVPKAAILIAALNNEWANVDGQTIVFECLMSDPQTGVFDINLAANRKYNTVRSYNPADMVYQTIDTYTTYPADMATNTVTFATGKYYAGKIKAGVNYVYIMMK